MRDIGYMARHFGTFEGEPDWDPLCDITGHAGKPDGKVCLRDIAIVARHFAEEC